MNSLISSGKYNQKKSRPKKLGTALNLIRLFINHGANINAIGLDGRAPIHIAISHGNIDIVNLFKTYGADF